MLLGAEFVAAVQVIVYAGAIMVLFVFVIMLLNAGRRRAHRGQPGGDAVWSSRNAGGERAGRLGADRAHPDRQTVAAGALPGAPRTIGWLLFHDFLLPFEVTSVLMLIAIMGAVVLASHPERTLDRKER